MTPKEFVIHWGQPGSKLESDLHSVIADELKKFKEYFNSQPYTGIVDIIDEDIDNYLNQSK